MGGIGGDGGKAGCGGYSGFNGTLYVYLNRTIELEKTNKTYNDGFVLPLTGINGSVGLAGKDGARGFSRITRIKRGILLGAFCGSLIGVGLGFLYGCPCCLIMVGSLMGLFIGALIGSHFTTLDEHNFNHFSSSNVIRISKNASYCILGKPDKPILSSVNASHFLEHLFKLN